MLEIRLSPVTRSIEDYRIEQLYEVREFVAILGITEQTYQRLIKHPDAVRLKTKQQMFLRLREKLPNGASLSPHHIREFGPVASPAVMAQLQAIIEEANRDGWIVCDPDTLEPTGEVRDGNGTIIERTSHVDE